MDLLVNSCYQLLKVTPRWVSLSVLHTSCCFILTTTQKETHYFPYLMDKNWKLEKSNNFPKVSKQGKEEVKFKLKSTIFQSLHIIDDELLSAFNVTNGPLWHMCHRFSTSALYKAADAWTGAHYPNHSGQGTSRTSTAPGLAPSYVCCSLRHSVWCASDEF